MITTNTRTKDPVDGEINSFDPKAAAAEAYRILKENGPMSGEDVTIACKKAGHVPKDDRAFGGVYFGLSKSGKIIRIDEAKRKRGHGTSGANIWGAV